MVQSLGEDPIAANTPVTATTPLETFSAGIAAAEATVNLLTSDESSNSTDGHSQEETCTVYNLEFG